MRRSVQDNRAAAPARRRSVRPTPEGLETRLTPAAIDLASIASAPYGVQNVGPGTNSGSGYAVTDVGDVNGDGFDDYVIGSPTAAVSGTQPVLGGGAGGASLVLGSRQVNTAAIVDFLGLNQQQRTGDLSLLGNVNQANPLNGLAGFAFDGVQISASRSPNGQLGASVAGVGDVNGDGLADFLIGAPGGADATGLQQGFGRAYLVYGASNIANVKLLDLDTPTSNPAARVATFVTTQSNSRLGQAVAGIGNFLKNGVNSIALGAPNASPTGLANSGAVYVISGAVLRTPPTAPIDVATVGQAGAGGTTGVLIVGERAGAQAGLSLAPAGDVNGDNGGANGTPDDLLIGAPAQATYTTPPGTATAPGDAYLIYGANNLQAAQTPASNNVLNINLNRVGLGGTTTINGADFIGTNNGELVGFAVSSAGDFNGDGLSDILVGEPGRNALAGRAALIYGQSGAAAINGNFPLNALPATITSALFDGPQAGAQAGYSLTATGLINADTRNEIAVGAPGLNNNSGAVFLIPGNAGLIGGPFSLDTNAVQASPVSALVITSSQASQVPNFLGASLGARQFPIVGGRYIDSDSRGDFVIGAPGFSPTGAFQRQLAGTGLVLEGGFLANLLPIPSNAGIPVPIGVQTPTPPFTIDLPLANDTLQIFVGSNATVNPPFAPVTDINPATIVVNNVRFPNATVTADGDFNNDGITDAIVTITPASSLGLAAGAATITITGQTNGTPVRQFSGSAAVTVNSPGPIPPVFPGTSGVIAPLVTQFVPPFGESPVPAANTLGKLKYRPLPVPIATRQFQLTTPYNNRLGRFYGLKKGSKQQGNGKAHDPDNANTLGDKVFSRGKFPVGRVRYPRVVHDVDVIPSRPFRPVS